MRMFRGSAVTSEGRDKFSRVNAAGINQHTHTHIQRHGQQGWREASKLCVSIRWRVRMKPWNPEKPKVAHGETNSILVQNPSQLVTCKEHTRGRDGPFPHQSHRCRQDSFNSLSLVPADQFSSLDCVKEGKVTWPQPSHLKGFKARSGYLKWKSMQQRQVVCSNVCPFASHRTYSEPDLILSTLRASKDICI